MSVLFLVLAFNQNGLQNMMSASSCGCVDTICNPSRSSYMLMENIVSMILKATVMAKHIMSDSEMLYLAKKSNDPTHKVAVAFAYGMMGSANENLFELALDKNNIVSQASREAMIYIATTKLKKKGVDFGPFPTDDFANKEDAVKLWRLFFKKNDQGFTNCYDNCKKPAITY